MLTIVIRLLKFRSRPFRPESFQTKFATHELQPEKQETTKRRLSLNTRHNCWAIDPIYTHPAPLAHYHAQPTEDCSYLPSPKGAPHLRSRSHTGA